MQQRSLGSSLYVRIEKKYKSIFHGNCRGRAACMVSPDRILLIGGFFVLHCLGRSSFFIFYVGWISYFFEVFSLFDRFFYIFRLYYNLE